jgi:hypothetical protein
MGGASEDSGRLGRIFEDEYDALIALGVVPLNRLNEDALEIA